jgi:hypothetical protein
MPDINKEATAFWNAIKPAIDEEIKKQTKGMVQRRKVKVTTAPANSVIGVTEPFGEEIFLPYVSNLGTAVVGDMVWVEFVYGASNSFVSMFADPAKN